MQGQSAADAYSAGSLANLVDQSCIVHGLQGCHVFGGKVEHHMVWPVAFILVHAVCCAHHPHHVAAVGRHLGALLTGAIHLHARQRSHLHADDNTHQSRQPKVVARWHCAIMESLEHVQMGPDE